MKPADFFFENKDAFFVCILSYTYKYTYVLKLVLSSDLNSFYNASSLHLLSGVYVCGNSEENKPKAPQIIRCVLLLLKCRVWAYVCDERFLLTYD